jgi:hypothetical protein
MNMQAGSPRARAADTRVVFYVSVDEKSIGTRPPLVESLRVPSFSIRVVPASHSHAAIGQRFQLLCSSDVAFWRKNTEGHMVASTRRRRPEIFSV